MSLDLVGLRFSSC